MEMRLNDMGEAVKNLQIMLNIALDGELEADGHFGEKTEAAVKAFQQEAGLVVDGAAGVKTLSALRGGNADRLMKESDLQLAAKRLGVPLAAIKAVNAVESAGAGFLPDGRPVILFERHVMHERLREVLPDGVEALSKSYPALINVKRGGYSGGSAEWLRMQNAGLVSGHDDVAFESASWGAFQIMGYHWQALGYASVTEFVEAMKASEGRQLEAFVRFIEADPALLKALKGRKWADFARRYNGQAYRENLYDVKLARAFERFSGEPEGAAA